jgi:hypothetical protein
MIHVDVLCFRGITSWSEVEGISNFFYSTSQDAKVDLKPLIVAIIPIYCLSETINVLFFLFLNIFNKLIIFSSS